GNYGFFNYLSLALCLWVLDDGHLAGLARRLGRPVRPEPVARPGRVATAALGAAAAVLVALTLVPFLPFVPGARPFVRAALPVRALLDEVRSINAYHLFAQMTLVRREPVIEGSDDGVTWQSYELRYEPGDVDRPPPLAAPPEPAVDFRMWFLLLGGRMLAPGSRTLLDRLLHEPAAVAPLFARDPFPAPPPRFLRLAVYRYRFSDAATRAATGAWWTRELEGTTRPISD